MKQQELNKQLLDFAETLLDENHQLSFRMSGNSMYPALKAGDIGFVQKCDEKDLNKGDIIVFNQNGRLVAHRLIGMFTRDDIQFIIAKGDKNSYTDNPITIESLIGKVYSFQRGNKKKKIDSTKMKLNKFVALHFSTPIIPFYNFRLQAGKRFNLLWSELKSIKNNISIVSKESEKILFVNIIISILQGVLPFIIIVCIKTLIDQLTSISTQNESQRLYFTVILIITALVFLASGVLSELKTYFSLKLSQSITHQIYQKLHWKHASLDLSRYESPAEQDKIHRAVQEASFRPIKIVSEMLIGIKSVAAALFLVGLFITIKWHLIVILIIAIIPGVYFRLKSSRKLYKQKEAQSTKEREMYYFNRILTGLPFAKEMKLFGFFDFFKQHFSNVQNMLFEQQIKLRKSELWLNIFAQIFSVSLIFLSLGFVSYLKIKGEISIGTVALFFFAFQRGYGVLNELFMSATQILEDNTFLNDFIAFLNMPTSSNSLQSDHSFSLSKEIRIENVRFRYKSSKRDALKLVNITIPAGKTVAFVGANGSGKTTLIKLLCGFYQPDSGRILFDGIDATEIGQQKICENITAVFQDFALYNISAINNIGLGNTRETLDFDKAVKAAKAAGINDILEHLPNGYNTLLGNLFSCGEELSIGQWQKMAIARAFYRDSSLVLLDEPSSALDAESELQIINGLKKLSHDKTAVIISHRLSTVQWADIIYVFNDGEVVESGNHQELLQLGGKYYSLFHTNNNQSIE
ncbi:ABC transporter related protein [Paludibacter propionicigenes WB4]|uniref:Signal peptidase I n=1 Tax=Paludibacter propionicigenes (strain DSM 17365 / JCM 13257 / WB4) TaxID=694427 RepID=E4T3H2_PALPW|nr:signal peptidase I [Paludibacter propionicigenes]ADQ79266.1 ABC transporter related protein [Paludibacter propionicigenes WB4]